MYLILLLLSGFPGIAQPGANEKILVIGDSLSAGYGLAANESWVALLSARLASQGYGYHVLNASITGDTTRGGRARLPGALDRHSPAIVIIELGGNDGLRGISIAEMRTNLAAMIEASRGVGADVILVGMQIPPNYGREYASRFAATFEELAAEHATGFVPFLLDGVALDDGLMQPDGIHPNARAQQIMLDNVWPTLAELLGDGDCHMENAKSLNKKEASG